MLLAKVKSLYTLIAFATQWGPKHGGINSFNADFLSAFGIAYHHSARTICVVSTAQADEIEQAKNCHVELIPLPYSPNDKALGAAHGKAAVDEIQSLGIAIGKNTVWLGHDRITGEAAIAAAQASEGRSAIIHHMSYDHYEAYAENAASAQVKVSQQNKIFSEADVLLAVGPLLRDALGDLARGSGKSVQMLIPGLAEIEPLVAPATFSAFLSGRLSQDAARIKQGHLGIAAFAKAHGEACDNPGLPQALRKQPKLKLRGVDLEQTSGTASTPQTPDLESELKTFAEDYAHRVINLHPLPFTHSREELYGELRSASVALMPSWHEGFGLVAWEAIAAGVPLIISRNSGVFQLLEEKWSGTGPGCVFPVDIRGKVDEPYFRDEDLNAVADLLKQIALDTEGARRKASNLRALVGDCTWAACAGQAVESFGWSLQQGVIPESIPNAEFASTNTATSTPTEIHISSISIPPQVWQRGHGVADSQLLRAEEACVPFDTAHQPELDKLQAWAENNDWPRALRLITGVGGSGKTRLALEFCERLAKQGWHTGFLAGEVEARQAEKISQELHKLNQPQLIVIDYAETRQPVLLALIKAMLQAGESRQRVRLLLLARDGGEWWEQLPAKDALCEPLLNGRATSGPFILPELHPAADTRPTAYTVALHAYAKALGVTAPQTIPDLQGEHFGRPLYLQMAALLALHGERPTTAEGLTRALLNHERRYWRGLLANYALPDTEQSAAHLMTLSTLVGGFITERDAESCWLNSGALLDRPAFKTMFYALANLYPGKQGLQVLRPDLLGETLVAQALLGSESDFILDSVLGQKSSNEKRRHALTVLARIVGRRTDLDAPIRAALVRQFTQCATTLLEVICETPSPLSRLTEEAFARLDHPQKSQSVGLLEPLLQHQSIQLAELDCQVGKFTVEKEKHKCSKRARPIELASYALALQNCSTAHSWAGHFDEALSYSQQAVELFCKLAKISETYQVSYTHSLNALAGCLNQLDQFEAALDHAKPALENWRHLAEIAPGHYQPELSTSIHNIAVCLGNAGQTDAAFEHATEALKIRQRLSETNPEIHETDYASSLLITAVYLRELGQTDSALQHSTAALEIFHRLADNNPDHFSPKYAISLSNTAKNLDDLGKFYPALEHAIAALNIFQHMADTRPDRYGEQYATALRLAAYLRCNIAWTGSALNEVRSALAIFTRLAQAQPHRFEDELFGTRCDFHFYNWLSGEEVTDTDIPTESALQNHLLTHHQQKLVLYSSFVRGCAAKLHDARFTALQRVCTLWPNLSVTERYTTQCFWLCAAAYKTHITGTDLDWLTSWEQFITQRQNILPWWMDKVAHHLGFSWPKTIGTVNY